MMAVKAFALAVMACLAGAPACPAAAPDLSPVRATLIPVDWQGPAQLPPRFRNHCSVDWLSGRVYCADHCGIDYQFYACAPASFGCCHVGRGYCDWNGRLRCRP